MDLARITKAHINIRDARHDLRATYENEDKKLKETQEKLEGFMLDHLQQNNVDSVKTDAGTFYRQEEVTPTAADWNIFYDWIKEHDAFEALERRIKKTFVKEYMEMNDDAVPPGVNVFREYVVRVRRSNGK